jgi:hypothetical protein
MKPAWRGFVVDGEVWAWPTLLFDHKDAMATLHALKDYTCRWRQWEPGGRIDFDRGASAEDRAKVEAWVQTVTAAFKTSGSIQPEHPGAHGASLTGVTVPPNAARPSPNPRAVVRRPGASTPHEHEEA